MIQYSILTSLLTVFCIIFIPIGFTQYIEVPPTDAAGRVGDIVNLMCKVNGTHPIGFSWREYITDEGGNVIFNDLDGKIRDPDKYNISGRYDLWIKNLDASNGGLYRCDILTGDQQISEAKVLSFEYPDIYMPNLTENVTTNMTCTSTFHTINDLPRNETPEMILLVNGKNLTSMEKILTESGTRPRQSKYQLSGVFTYSPLLEDLGSMCECIISSISPDTFNISHKSINIEKDDIWYGTRNISIKTSQLDSILKVGIDNLTCWADGYPKPQYLWEPIDSPAVNITFKESVLPIIYDMCKESANISAVINNTWRCIAYNNPFSTEATYISESKNVTFQIDVSSCTPPTTERPPVTETEKPTGKPPTGGLKKGAKIGIGCGVAAAVLVVAGVVGGVCGHKHKKRKRTMSTSTHEGYDNEARDRETDDAETIQPYGAFNGSKGMEMPASKPPGKGYGEMVQPHGVVTINKGGFTEADAFKPQSVHYASAGVKAPYTGAPAVSEYAMAKSLPEADPSAVYSEVKKNRKADDETTMWENTMYAPYDPTRDQQPTSGQTGPTGGWRKKDEDSRVERPPISTKPSNPYQ